MRLFHSCHPPVRPGFDSGFDDIGGLVFVCRDVLPFLKTSGLIGFDLMYVDMKSPHAVHAKIALLFK